MEPLLVQGRCVSLHENGVELWSDKSETVGLVGAVSGIEWLKRDDETQVMSMRVGGGSYEFTAQWM